ncbi:MAG: TatD family hydrolase [Sulfuriflexus sp.]|nr:TatD family hydrolase [Sulfuriflexus sp.]
MLIDSHCHIDLMDYEKLGGDPDTAVAYAHENGISHMLCVSVNLEQYPNMLNTIDEMPNVFASVGVHPNEQDGLDPSVEQLVELADNKKVVAIGETGLDYFRSEGDLEWQRDRFRRHIEAAKQTGKPLIIHSREAKEDTIKLLQEENAQDIGGVMHCFAEDWEMAQQAMDLNFYISFSGIVTFKSAKTLQDVAKRVPLDRMLVETDSPWLAPMPFRGKTNQPAYVKYVAETIAELRNDSVDSIATATTENFFRLFDSAKP